MMLFPVYHRVGSSRGVPVKLALAAAPVRVIVLVIGMFPRVHDLSALGV